MKSDLQIWSYHVAVIQYTSGIIRSKSTLGQNVEGASLPQTSKYKKKKNYPNAWSHS